MNGQRFRLLLQISIGLLAIGTPTVLAWAVLWPVGQPDESGSTADQKIIVANVKPPETPHVPGPEEFGLLLYKPLQQELVADEALLSGQRQVVLKVVIPPPVKLLATMVESDQSAALFSTADGGMKWCRIGESISEATPMEVVTIEPATVVIRYLGQESTLKIPTASDG